MEVNVVSVPPADQHVGARETIPRWSDGSRLALGAWTFTMPLVAAVIAAWSVTVRETPPVLLAATAGLIVFHAIITLLYCAFAGQNPRIAQNRATWWIGLLLAGPVVIPVYWVMHVWYAPRVGRRNVDEEMPSNERTALPLRHAHA